MNKSRNILVTGASTGIGFDLSKTFLENGYTVFGSVRKPADADRLSKELGENFHPLFFDVTDHVAIDRAAEELTERIGDEGLAGLVNNAGIAVGGPFLHIDIEEFRYQFEVNVLGMVKVTQAFAPLLGARESHQSEPGRILQISSLAGKVAMPFIAPYVGSKHAVEGISNSLRRELLLYGIDVILIGPGPILTPIWEKGTSEEENEEHMNSPYGDSLRIFQNVFVKDAIKTGWTSEKLASEVLKIFEKKKPKVRYALTPKKFQNWTMPRLLPARTLDKFVGKNLKLFKK